MPSTPPDPHPMNSSKPPATNTTAGFQFEFSPQTMESNQQRRRLESESEQSSLLQLHPLRLHNQLSVLPYSVHQWSSYSAQYHPKNILVNAPTDQSSRWSSGSNNQHQYLLLKLQQPAIVHTITFGKYHKVHVCNLKEFKIYGGLTPDHLQELLHSGLRNDNEPETFPLKYKSPNNHQIVMPCLYIKIVPLMAWGANFNFSIWFVEVRGVEEAQVVRKAMESYHLYREQEAVRLCLKHLRQRHWMQAFQTLQHQASSSPESSHLLPASSSSSNLGSNGSRTGGNQLSPTPSMVVSGLWSSVTPGVVNLEHPLLTHLHQTLVQSADFQQTEQLIQDASSRGWFNQYIQQTPYTPQWTRIYATDVNGNLPPMRGGHQMCIDVRGQMIYLLGGWDGHKDLSDFWQFDVREQRWTLLSADTRSQGGPGPRSCHKVCLDGQRSCIFVLGRYVDPSMRAGMRLSADFFRYDLISQEWTRLSEDVTAEGGPELIYDHQMVVDEEEGVLYVFGGRIIVTGTNNTGSTPALESAYSGLYAYHIASNKWRLIRSDQPTNPGVVSSSNSVGTGNVLKSRIGHSMLFNPQTRQLYVFAGQRLKDYLSDFYIYSIPDDLVIEMSRDSSKSGGPDAGFTQRATIDVERGEFYVFSGLMREKGGQECVKNQVWVYDINTDRWMRVYQNDADGQDVGSNDQREEPSPRFAHQVVYDHINKVQYLFGGNPGEPGNSTMRLDDFWSLRLLKPNSADIFRRCCFLIRKQKFKEICAQGDSLGALKYLKEVVGEVVRHDDRKESFEFRQLTAGLFEKSGESIDVYKSRNELYEQLLEFFPDSMKQPTGNLIDLIQ